MKKFCCEGFQRNLEDINEPGFAIIPRRKFGADYFALRAWWGNRELWAKLAVVAPEVESLRVSTETGASFCPWCGANLTAWIASHPAEFEVLLKQVVD